MERPAITPMPPLASTVGLPWDARTEDPAADLRDARASLGDTFVVDSGDDRYLFVFSAPGVAAFYALPESMASKGVADWRMLRRKLPDELFAGRRMLPDRLFGRDDVADYVRNVSRALEATVDELGPEGQVDVFALSRRLGHRIGLASWGGPGAARGDTFERLVEAFDTLDGADSFVHPDAMAAVASSGKSAEYRALDDITEVFGVALDELPGTETEHPLFARVAANWSDEPEEVRRTGLALDVVLIHIASMSNLFAAIGWALIDLLAHPREAAGVRDGDRRLAESCALESTRLAQRSIMARYVLKPIRMEVGDGTYEVSPGVTVATFLPLTNSSAAPGLDVWDLGHWNGRRLADTSELRAVELVTTFGHGRHTCPAQPFSLSAMTSTVSFLLAEFDMVPMWSGEAGPVRNQIGGVARAADPCPLRYRRRARS
ncbi:MAG: cytochrome [Acidimicrobiales bacterium]